MRLFIAVPVSEQTIEWLKGIIAQIQSELPEDVKKQIRWIPPENYHMTLYFLGGNVPEVQLPAIQQALSTCFSEGMSAFEAEVESIGCFPSPQQAKHIVARLSNTILLQYLQDEVVQNLKPLGFKKPKHRFIPHITLSHLNPVWETCDINMDLTQEETPLFVPIEQVCLYQSLSQPPAWVRYQALKCLSLETY